MLLHLTPRFLPESVNQQIRLLEVVFSSQRIVPPFISFASCKISYHPNMLTFSQRVSSVPRSGIFVDVDIDKNDFDVTYLWEVDGFFVVPQIVHYHLLDSKFDAFSDEPGTWQAMTHAPLSVDEVLSPGCSDPIFMTTDLSVLNKLNSKIQTSMGLLLSVEQHFFGPSIESARLMDPRLRRFTPKLPLPRSII